MPADGKDNSASIAKRVAAGETVHILITDGLGDGIATDAALQGGDPARPWRPATRKTKVVTACVTGADAYMVAHRRRAQRRYTLQTDRGDVANLAPIETLWLGKAPAEPAKPAARKLVARRIPEPAAPTPATEPAGPEPTTPSEEEPPPSKRRPPAGPLHRRRRKCEYSYDRNGGDCPDEVTHTAERPGQPVPGPPLEVCTRHKAWLESRDGWEFTPVNNEPAKPDPRRAEALRKHIDGYAAKFYADTAGATYAGPTTYSPDVPGEYVEPTDENLARVLANCGRRPEPDEYADIRAEVVKLHAERTAEAAVRIERHRASVTQGEVSVSYQGNLLGRFGDKIQLCPDKTLSADKAHDHGGAPCFGGWVGRPDRYWIAAAARIVAARKPDGEPAGDRVRYEAGDRVKVDNKARGEITTDIEAAKLDAVAAAEADTHGDGPAEPEAAPAEPDPKLIEAILRYGEAGAVAGMARIDAILSDPVVAAIRERAGQLTEAERERLHDAGLANFSRHRQELTQLHHKVAKAAPDRWRDFGMAADRVWSVVDAADNERRFSFAAHAVTDAVYASAAQTYLSPAEYQLFAGPWLALVTSDAA